MFVKAFKKAGDKVEHAVESAAVEAAFGLTTILLACGAYIFAAAGAAFWLSTFMAVHFALLIVAASTGVFAFIMYFVGVRDSDHSHKNTDDEKAADNAASPLSLLLTPLGMRGTPLDIAAKGLFIKQLKSAPVATIAATVAIGAIAGILTADDDDDDA